MNTIMKRLRALLQFSCLGAVTLALEPAFAHHSFAMFDMEKNVTIEGTVKQVQWTNPHTWIQLLVPDATSGKEVEWSVEADSPNVLTRRGWSRKSIKAGDKAVLVIHPVKSDAAAKGGSLAAATVNGQRIGNQGPPRTEGVK
jgi:hypothetical protein